MSKGLESGALLDTKTNSDGRGFRKDIKQAEVSDVIRGISQLKIKRDPEARIETSSDRGVSSPKVR
jgi:hypothetical protein